MKKSEKFLRVASLSICLICVLFPPYIVTSAGNLFPGFGICYAPIWGGPVLMDGDTAELLYAVLLLELVGVFILFRLALRVLRFFAYIFNNGVTQDIEQ